MSAADAVEILDRLEDAGIVVWLDGGWGVDAALETQTRSHDDLDVVVELHAVAALEETLGELGYGRVRGTPPLSIELTDDVGRQVDVHPVALDEAENGVYRMEDGEDWIYPASGFTGAGVISGRRARCLTPEVQLLCHTGYEPHRTSYEDVVALSRRFGLPVPEEYARSPETYLPRTP